MLSLIILFQKLLFIIYFKIYFDNLLLQSLMMLFYELDILSAYKMECP